LLHIEAIKKLTKKTTMRNKSISTITKTSLLFALVFSGILGKATQRKKPQYSIITVNGFTFDLNRWKIR
jgi:hypothetical protein